MMNKYIKSIYFLAATGLWTPMAGAFEIGTHGLITNQAFLRCKLSTNPALSKQLGIDTYLGQGALTGAPFADQYFDFSGTAVSSDFGDSIFGGGVNFDALKTT